jgi:hypothetical protein
MEDAFIAVQNARVMFDACVRGRLVARLPEAGVRAAGVAPVTAGGCTDAQWKPLLDRAGKLKLRKFAPTVRKHLAARKAKKRAAAARYRARITRWYKQESRDVKAFDKLVKRTCS